MSLGPQELLIVLLIVLVLFGGAKLPKLAKSIGEAQREFKRGQEEGDKPKTAGDVVPPVQSDKHAGPGPVV